MRIGAITIGKKPPEDIIIEVPIGDEPVWPCPRPSSQSTAACAELYRPASGHAGASPAFFEHYKDREPGKWVKMNGRGDAAKARKFTAKRSRAQG